MKILWMMALALYVGMFLASEKQNFLTSFISNYGCSSNARDTRDYHPFILARTQERYTQLEEHIRSYKFHIDERIILCGYQEDAIANYYTSHTSVYINDEVSLKTRAGWDFAQGNVFGFLTGFLLKDVHHFNSCFEHIDAHRIGLFDDRATLFQRHAFGQAYQLLDPVRRSIERSLRTNDGTAVLAVLSEWWKYLYVYGVTDGAGHCIATQDILFSIAYAQALCASSLPIRSFFVGPDITYPIEVGNYQKAAATYGAQDCVERVVDRLRPIDGQKTAYIFCSFVDGVGKSTLLGNIKNWMRYRKNFDQYTRVDNSSTQHASSWLLHDDVLIVDLPAHSSHVLIKPDGFVYVDRATVKNIPHDECASMSLFIAQHASELINAYFNTVASVSADLERGILCKSNEAPERVYVENVCMMQRHDHIWIPGEYKNHHFLFNRYNHAYIRLLQPLNEVHSAGLKVVESEQMLFTKGVTVAPSYNTFLHTITDTLQEHAIERIVFVDFLSMYPRTSRENIRVNFLLQQLYTLFGKDFSQECSLYQSWVNGTDVYKVLKKKTAGVIDALMLESLLRSSVYDLLTGGTTSEGFHIAREDLAAYLSPLVIKRYESDGLHAQALAARKIIEERDRYSQQYDNDKDFELYSCFNAERVCAFSHCLEKLFTYGVSDEYLNSMWRQVSGNICSPVTTPMITLDSGFTVECVGLIGAESRDKIELKESAPLLRAQWYASLCALLQWRYDCMGVCRAPSTGTAVPALHAVSDGNNVYCIQPCMVPTESSGQLPRPFFDNDSRVRRWGLFKERLYCVQWQGINTGCGVYAFGYCPQGNNALSCVVRTLKEQYKQQGMSNAFVSASAVYNCLVNEGLLQRKAGSKTEACRELIQYCVRALATLEMIVRDPVADIVVRAGSRHDFKAALLLIEYITLPTYFNLSSACPLFDDYDAVEPIIPWEAFDG